MANSAAAAHEEEENAAAAVHDQLRSMSLQQDADREALLATEARLSEAEQQVDATAEEALILKAYARTEPTES